MTTTRFPTTQYTAEHFVESAGAILFHISTQRICLVHLKPRDEWILAKGRRNVGEFRAVTALREVTEETGIPCRPLTVRMKTRAPPAIEPEGGSPDVVREHEGSMEPFMVTLRQTGDEEIKFIWWYIAAVDEEKSVGVPEERYEVVFLPFGEAVEKLTFQSDRDVVAKAVKIVKGED